MGLAVGADVGGTFTDFVSFDGTCLESWKRPTTDPQSHGVAAGFEDRLRSVSLFTHGTTVATNALLEERGCRVALITTAGFEDVIEIARQKRPSLYDNAIDRPRPLVDRTDRVGHRTIAETVDRVRSLDADAVSVVLLSSYLDPKEELELVAALRAELGGTPVSSGVELTPGFREFERVSTVVLNAYLTPSTSSYLDDVARQIPAATAMVMTSSGGLVTLREASMAVGQLTLSGPAGGVVAADALRGSLGVDHAISFDMGGTSTDVCRIGPDGYTLSPSQDIGGRVNRVSSMPIRTVGAGGGSIAWCDGGGALRVGPRSAGAHPGPAAYGMGGVEPTVTDANVLLGNIPTSVALGGELALDIRLAGEAISRLGEKLGLSPLETARGILEVVDAHMDRAIRSVSVEVGFDPRQASLIAFGGAGGLHASRLARSLGMRSVLVPPHSGAFSALGLLMARPRVEATSTIMKAPEDPAVVSVMDGLARDAIQRFKSTFGREPLETAATVEARYSGQSHEVLITYRPDQLSDDFEREHRSRFGFALEGVRVEVVNGRVAALGEAPLHWQDVQVRRASDVTVSAKADRVWRREGLAPGVSIEGPGVIVDDDSSTLLGLGDQLGVLADGTMEITW